MDSFDTAIIGGGLSGLIQADLLSDSADSNLRVVIIDPTPDALKHKTFASWQSKSQRPHRYSQLVSHRWEKFRITDPHGAAIDKSFGDYHYERIPGEALFNHIYQKLKQDPRFTWLQAEVIQVSETSIASQGKTQALLTLNNGQSLQASKVLSAPIKSAPSVIQYFFGFEIQTPTDHFDADLVDLMDFSIEQAGEVRFVYTLPFSKRHGLVEFTVFAENMMPLEDCESILLQYIKDHLELSDYTIQKIESGVIPMAEDPEPLFSPSFHQSIVNSIGSAAGMIKPSTGYSFQRNLEFSNLRQSKSYGLFRYQVYDSILLDIIRTQGGLVSGIFSTLFRNNSSSQLFSFLDEKTSFREELKIFYSLPWFPFISRLIALYPFFFAVMTTLVLHWAGSTKAVWILPLLGLITSGIGHGSLDHLLDPAKKGSLSFYIRYLGLIACFLATWFVFPTFALAYFIFQSADHFGESNWIRALRNSKNDFLVRGLTWSWGLFAAIFGVLFHWDESRPLIQAILGSPPWIDSLSFESARGLASVLFFAATLSALVLDRYDVRATGRPASGLPATLLLGLSIMALPLLPGFFCFFAFWHGWDSMKSQKQITGWRSSEYIRKALPFTAISICGIGALFFIYSNFSDSTQLWKILFVMIGALTAAHAPVMNRFLLSSRPLNSRS